MGSGFSEREQASMRERAAELRTQARRGRTAEKAAQRAAADAADVLAKIEAMPEGDRALARRVHEVVTTAAPDLAPKLYYGQPGYAREGKVVCFFRSGEMDKLRYSTFGFSPQADLDEADGMWATSYALTTGASEVTWERIGRLVERAAGDPAAAEPAAGAAAG